MAHAAIGVDILEIARMKKVLERRPSFLRRVFTQEERIYCEACLRPAAHYAARFAAREAVLKALGCGFSCGIGIQDISVDRDDAGKPVVVLRGKAQQIAHAQGILELALSLSLTHDVAVANVVAVTEEVQPQKEDKIDPEQELRKTFKRAKTVIEELERTQLEGSIDAEKAHTATNVNDKATV